MVEKLTEAQRTQAFGKLKGWGYEPKADALTQDFKFKDFSEAFAFMTRVALLAEKADHHPDWSNSWNKVTIDLVSHDLAEVSPRDERLAEAINAIL